jgi:hypothetical protein
MEMAREKAVLIIFRFRNCSANTEEKREGTYIDVLIEVRTWHLQNANQ